MKALPVIIAAAVAITVIRLRLRRRGRRSSPWLVRLRSPFAGRRVLGDTGLVAGREIRERLRGRVFRVVTAVLFVAVGAAVVIPTIHSGTTHPTRVGVVGGTAAIESELQALARSIGLTVELTEPAGLGQARAALDAGRLDVVVEGEAAVVLKNPLSASDTSAGARYVRAASVALGAQQAFSQAGLTPAQAAQVAKAEPLPVESIHPGKRPKTTAEATALLGVILVFVVLTQYLTWTLMGVMEEKASRVVEVLLATVRPIQLLAGKVIGIGTVALTQAVALVAFALVLADLVGSSLVHGAAPLVVASTLVWLLLGYAFYSWLYAAAGSLAERQDQVQSLALPLSAPLIFGYIVSLTGVSSGHASLLVKVLAYLPPTAPFAMPTLVGFGAASWWQFVLSVVVSYVCTFLVALVAARVYRTAVLRTGARVQLRHLLAGRAHPAQPQA
jgi:ABC-2 type transport system permease protein